MSENERELKETGTFEVFVYEDDVPVAHARATMESGKDGAWVVASSPNEVDLLALYGNVIELCASVLGANKIIAEDFASDLRKLLSDEAELFAQTSSDEQSVDSPF